jgi:hypothetical protein
MRRLVLAVLAATILAGCGHTTPAELREERGESEAPCWETGACTPEDAEWWERGDDACATYVGSPECPITPCITTTVRPEGHVCVVEAVATTVSSPWPLDVGVPLCELTLARDGDTVAWQIESNSPNGVLELRTAPGDVRVATVTLDDAGAGSGTVPAIDSPSTWLTAWIEASGERGGCASVRYPTL